MVQAAVSGAIDFREADLLDRYWWLKLRWTLNQLEDNNAVEVLKLQHAQHCAVADYTLEEQAFKYHWDGANSTSREVSNLLFPWAKKAKADSKSRSKELMAEWKKRYGDIRDPQVRKKFEDLADKLRAHTARQVAKSREEDPKRAISAKLKKMVAAKQSRRPARRRR